MKKALTVGINYPGQPHFLRGCVNDSITIHSLLTNMFGFTEIVSLHDNEATTARMLEELRNLVDGARPGDVLFFHFSGHGTQMINERNDDHEPDGLDEVICPVDFDWQEKVIRDDHLKAIFDAVPDGVNLTVFLDCCNSGSGFDALNEYQSNIGNVTRGKVTEDGNRYLPPPPDIAEKIKASHLRPKHRQVSRNVDSSGMLISGAQAHQTAADAYINGMYQGATTYYLKRTLQTLGKDITYRTIIDQLNQHMVDNGFSQRPQLDGPEILHDRVFLSEYDFGDPDAVATPPSIEELLPEENKPDTIITDGGLDKPTVNIEIDTSTTINTNNPEKEEEKDEDDKKNHLPLILGIVGVIIAGIVFAIGV